MSFSHWITVAAVAFLPLAATAQQVQQPNPTDATAAVAETSYISAFKSYITTPEETATPEQVWRAANEEVARNDPHTGHGGPGSMSGMTSQPAPQQAGSAQADPHAAHRGHGATPGMKAEPVAKKSPSTQRDPHAGHGAAMAAPKANTSQPDPHAGHNMQGK